MSVHQKSIAAYLRALRATRIAFAGDTPVLTAARQQIRSGFENPNPEKSVQARLREINNISKFLMQNIVQGKKTEGNRFMLNIHKHTELGDNESIKKTKQVLVEQGGGCCGGANAKI